MPFLEYDSNSKQVSFGLPRSHGKKVDIGRDDNNDIVLPDREVALFHASVVRANNGLYVLMSKGLSQLKINDHDVPDLKILREGDVISLGQTILRYVEIRSTRVVPGSESINVACVFCHSPLQEGDEIVCCPKCDTAYHEACWSLLINESCPVPHCDYLIEHASGA